MAISSTVREPTIDLSRQLFAQYTAHAVAICIKNNAMCSVSDDLHYTAIAGTKYGPGDGGNSSTLEEELSDDIGSGSLADSMDSEARLSTAAAMLKGWAVSFGGKSILYQPCWQHIGADGTLGVVVQCGSHSLSIESAKEPEPMSSDSPDVWHAAVSTAVMKSIGVISAVFMMSVGAYTTPVCDERTCEPYLSPTQARRVSVCCSCCFRTQAASALSSYSFPSITRRSSW